MEEYQGLREEVDFQSLLFYILERWRWMIVSMLIFALLAGGYKYQSVTNINSVVNQAKETKSEALAEEKKKTLKPQLILNSQPYLVTTFTPLDRLLSHIQDGVCLQID